MQLYCAVTPKTPDVKSIKRHGSSPSQLFSTYTKAMAQVWPDTHCQQHSCQAMTPLQ